MDNGYTFVISFNTFCTGRNGTHTNHLHRYFVGAPEITPVFDGVRVAQSLVFLYYYLSVCLFHF